MGKIKTLLALMKPEPQYEYSDIELALVKATGLYRNPLDSDQVWLEKLIRAANDLADDAFFALPTLCQDWCNAAVNSIQADQAIVAPAYLADQRRRQHETLRYETLDRLRLYGIRPAARLVVLNEQGVNWCLAMLACCDKRRDGGDDPEVASYWCKAFVRNPAKFREPGRCGRWHHGIKVTPEVRRARAREIAEISDSNVHWVPSWANASSSYSDDEDSEHFVPWWASHPSIDENSQHYVPPWANNLPEIDENSEHYVPAWANKR